MTTRARTGTNARGTPRVPPPGGAVGPIDTDDVINVSAVPGATTTAALNFLLAALAPQSWASVLAEGNTTDGSGANNPTIVENDALVFGGSAQTATTGIIRLPNVDAWAFNYRNQANSADLGLISKAGASNDLAFGNSTGNTTVNSADAGSGLALQTGGTLRASLTSARAELAVAILQFATAVLAPSITQAATGGAAGQDLSISAQGAVTTGGNLVLSGGAAVTRGSVDVSNDSPLRFTGANPTAATGSMRVPSGWTLNYRNAVDTADLTAAQLGNGADDNLLIGNSTGQTIINSSPNLLLRTNGGNRLLVGSSVLRSVVNLIDFANSVSAPRFEQQTTAGAGQTLTVNAQSSTASTGGNLVLGGGSGATANGNIALGIAPASFESMARGVFVANSTAAPTANPASGIFLYVEAGTLRARGLSGTITDIAPP